MVKEELEPIEDVLKFIENDLLDDNERYRFKQRRLSINQERWLSHIKDRDTIIKGLRDTICFQCQMLAYKHSKKKPNPSCGNCMNGPNPHNPLQKALDHIKDLEAKLKARDEPFYLTINGERHKIYPPNRENASKPEFPDVSDPKYKTFDDYEEALEQYMIDTHDDGRTLPKPKEAPLTEKEWTPYADALKIKTGVKKPKEGKK